ncbi:hypothetical protein ACJJTC_003113 [Scirpophaga incertulas]
MLTQLTVCILFLDFFTTTRCAPRLGSILSDPFTSDEEELTIFDLTEEILKEKPIHKKYFQKLTDYRRNSEHINEIPKAKQLQKTCSGYDYDHLNCKIANNRILCGYNKNKQTMSFGDEIIDMGDGCFLRKDRIECRYFKERVNVKTTNRVEIYNSYETDESKKTFPTKLPSDGAIAITLSKRNTQLPIKLNLQSDKTIPQSDTTVTSNKIVRTHFSPESKTLTESSPTEQNYSVMESIKDNKHSDTSFVNTTTIKPSTICIDKQDSIVCYETKRITVYKKKIRK